MNIPERPDRFKPLPYNTDGLCAPDAKSIIGVQKIFNDPDFVHIGMNKGENGFHINWATQQSASESLDALAEFIESNQLDSGAVNLRHTFHRPGVIMGGSNRLTSEIDDIVNEVHDSANRTISYTLFGPQFEMRWQPSWPKTYHDTPSNEILIRFNRRRSISRFVIDHCVTLTAMKDFKSSFDSTMDEFAEFEPRLKS